VPPVAPSPTTAENATAPARPELPTAAPEAAVAPVAGAKPAAESMKKPPAKTVSAPAPKPREPAAKPSADKQKPKPSPAAVAPSSYAINVGVFADAANSERVQAQLKAAKLAVYTQQIEGAKGTLTRVRVGPFADPEQAAAAAQRIRALGLDAVVFRP
jgi:cell division septation protein DedD